MSQRRHSNKTALIAAGIALPLLLLAIVLLPPWLRSRRAQNDVDQLAIALKSYALEFGQPPSGSPADVCAALRGSNPRREAVVENYRVNSEGLFLDPYETPYQINAGSFRVYSLGPNRKDDNGQGDDIVSRLK